MKSLKVKSTENGLTLIPDTYPIGHQRTGATNYLIENIPDEVSAQKVIKILGTCFLPADEFEINWAEIHAGKVFRKIAKGRPVELNSMTKKNKAWSMPDSDWEWLEAQPNQSEVVREAIALYRQQK